MHTVKLITSSDCTALENGFEVLLTTISGERFRVTSADKDVLVETANEFLRNEMSRLGQIESYIKGVEALCEIALNQDGSGAGMAAQVLLSAYNNNFPLEVARLNLLDEIHLQHAIAVIAGRSVCNEEPHTLIENGDEIFRTLWKMYEPSLHVKNRR